MHFPTWLFQGALPTPRLSSRGWGGEEGCGRCGACHLSGWSRREGEASAVTEQKPREPRPCPPRPRPGRRRSLARRLSRAQSRRTRNPLGPGSSPPPRTAHWRTGIPGETSGPRGGGGETPPRPDGQRLSLQPAWSRGEWRCGLRASARLLPESRRAGPGRAGVEGGG